MPLFADVILPLPLDQPYTYSLAEEMKRPARVGSRVLVPLGGRWLTGIIVGFRKRKPGRALEVKPIAEVLDETPLFTSELLAFVRRLGRYYVVPWGEMLPSAVPPSLLVRSRASVLLTEKGKKALERGLLSEDERRLAVLLEKKPHSPLFLESKSGAKNVPALIARMRRKEFVAVERSIRRVRRRSRPEPSRSPAQLELDFSVDERVCRAVEMISGVMAKKAFSSFLLFGAAGRRKDVYSRLLREAVSKSGSVLYLVPEISLTSGLIEEFEKSLGGGLAVFHSGKTDRQRELEWQEIKEGRVRVVIGARSALFSPLRNLRLIILDEEQDESYSQQEGLPFDVRRAAGLRAEEEKAVLVMGSSAPTVESFYRARKGRSLVDVGPEFAKPKVTVIDSRGRPGLIDGRLVRAVRERLGKKEQAIIFFNRRGYASSLACNRCGFVPKCDRCDFALSYHKSEGTLVCHACHRSVPAELICPRCRGPLTVRRSAGIEAVAEDLRRTFPGNRVEVWAAGEAGRKEHRESLLREFEKGDIDILVGTHRLTREAGLPAVTFVGILHPEMVLHLADFRSGQRAFQIIFRTSRWLRLADDAELLIQTTAPDHYSIRAAAQGDYAAFYRSEIKFRRLLDYPPFSSLAEVVFSARNVRRAAAAARMFAAKVKDSSSGIQVFGPSLAPLARKRDLFRVQVSLKARRPESLRKVLTLGLKEIRSKKSVLLFP
ncbi:MAG: primosomal protein N' [Candidatus Aminicenantes bacterium]|nr:primosomal protein N' [Candidatus Aminicenantes bacterium]